MRDIKLGLEKYKEKHKDFLDKVNNMEIADKVPKEFCESVRIENFMLREVIIKKQGYVLLSKEWIKPLAEFIGDRKVLEIMSGCGSLAYALQREGVDIKATDNFSWNGASNWNLEKTYYLEIENIDCIDSINKYGKDTDIFIISWPYMDDTAYRCLKEIRKINKNALILYIGEWVGGCNADYEFFNELEVIRDSKINYIQSIFPSWISINDNIYLIK